MRTVQPGAQHGGSHAPLLQERQGKSGRPGTCDHRFRRTGFRRAAVWKTGAGPTRSASVSTIDSRTPKRPIRFLPPRQDMANEGIPQNTGKEQVMLWTLCVILIILWLLGLISGYTMGGVIHILLVIAIVVVLVRVIQGRRPV